MSELPAGANRPRVARQSIGTTRLDQVAKLSEREPLGLHGMGFKAIRSLKDALTVRGKKLKP